MRQTAKRILAVVISTLLLLTITAGCTSTNSGDSTTTESITTTSTEAPTSTESITLIESSTATELTSADSTTDSSRTLSTTTTKPTTVKATKPTTTTNTTTAKITKSSTTTKSTTTTTKKTLSEAEVKKLRDQVFFGYCRMGALDYLTIENMEKEAQKGHLNLLDGYTVSQLRKVDELGDDMMAWVSISTTIFTFASSGSYFNYGWQDAVREKMKEIEEEGLMEHVLGFSIDEPFLAGIKKEDFIEATKFLRETYPNLRVMTCFATNAIEPTVWSTGNDVLIDEESTKYLTDIAYDMYWDAKIHLSKYKKLNESMKKRLGNNNPRIWWLPCIMSSAGKTDEQYALDHLEMCFDFLMEEENPGGLICYAYDIANRDGDIGNIGYNEKQAEWTKLETRLIKIGKEIRSWNE